MPHYTADEWMRFVGEHMPDATTRGLDGYRDDNNVFVDGMPPPNYTGPLSTGGSAGVRPQAQGKTGMDPVDDQATGGALPGPTASPYKDLNEWASYGTGLTGEETAWNKQQDSARAAQYDAAQKALAARRFGPSKAEQLFALSAALAKPMIRPSFGGVMANVMPTLADIEKSNREAQVSRADALMQLQQSLASETNAAKQAEFKARREAWAAQGAPLARIAAAAARPPRTGFNPVTGALTYMDTGAPVGQGPLPTLTPDQVAEMSRDPQNKGKQFRTQDGRVMEIM